MEAGVRKKSQTFVSSDEDDVPLSSSHTANWDQEIRDMFPCLSLESANKHLDKMNLTVMLQLHANHRSI